MDDIEDFRRFDRVAAQVSKLGNVDVTIDQTKAVFIPPDNFESYVLLTKVNVDKWTRAIVIFSIICISLKRITQLICVLSLTTARRGYSWGGYQQPSFVPSHQTSKTTFRPWGQLWQTFEVCWTWLLSSIKHVFAFCLHLYLYSGVWLAPDA